MVVQNWNVLFDIADDAAFVGLNYCTVLESVFVVYKLAGPEMAESDFLLSLIHYEASAVEN